MARRLGGDIDGAEVLFHEALATLSAPESFRKVDEPFARPVAEDRADNEKLRESRSGCGRFEPAISGSLTTT
jgi:hypothetical protein